MPVLDAKPPKVEAKRNRNQFVRPTVPRVERISSFAILLVIAGIGAAILIKGRRFDPNIYSLRPDALKSTSKAVEGKSATLRMGRDNGGTEGTPSESAPKPVAAPAAETSVAGEYAEAATGSAPAKPATGEPMEIALPGIKPMGNTEFYSSETLYEKIDGRAPAYVSFNIQQLRSRSFSIAGTAAGYVDVYEYRFDSPINAFGLFAQERDPKGKPLEITPDGYASEMGFFFRQGSVYVQIICSDQDAKTLATARAIAENRAKALPVDDAGLAARRKLPAEGMVADSVTFVPENALGQSFLNNVFQATYNFGGQKLTFFLTTTTPETAAAAWKSFLTFSGKYGGTATELPDANGAKIVQAQNFDKWKVVYQRDGEIGGVIDASETGNARQFVEKYLQGQLH